MLDTIPFGQLRTRMTAANMDNILRMEEQYVGYCLDVVLASGKMIMFGK